VSGGSGADVFNVRATSLSPLNSLTLDGGLPTSPADTLNFDAGNLAVTCSPGKYRPGRLQPVFFSNFEFIHINNAAAFCTFYGPDTADRTALTGLDAAHRFVQVLYLNALGRVGSMAELDQWVAALNGPGGSTAAIANLIERSPEARDHLVTAWYLAFLNRRPINGEELGWASMLLLGQTEEQVLSDILGAPESFNHAQTLGSSGTPQERFVKSLYQLLLNRDGSPSEVAGFVNIFSAIGAQQIALTFLESSEFRMDLAEAYYNALLHRASDAATRSAWAASSLDAATMRVVFDASSEVFTNG
jgi:hypothetical protein